MSTIITIAILCGVAAMIAVLGLGTLLSGIDHLDEDEPSSPSHQPKE